MKLYKSLLFGLLMCGFAACDTTDLERDINSLKDRVEDYEAQVQKLNDDMNIIRVLLDGNKTITSYSFDGTNYTLTLSNGETLTLTQGVVGANYPSITIDEESGNWIIAGKDSGVKAETEDGKDAPYTPQFKIENENWWVSYDGKNTWENLGVVATGTPSDKKSPITDVDTTDPNFIKITLEGEQEPRVIPVIRDLVCEITEPELADGEMWYIGSNGATLKVKVNIQSGDIIRPVVPADWKAEITEQNEGELKVKVTSPAYASKCVVTIEVNRGANTITDEIVARTQTTSYYADYMAGLDIKIGDLVINRFGGYKDAILLQNGGSISKSGVYFVEKGATVTWTGGGSDKLVIIGDDTESYVNLQYSGAKSFSLGGASSVGFICKGVKLSFPNLTANYVWGLADGVMNNLVFDNCEVEIPKGKSLTFFNSQKGSIEKILIISSKVSLENRDRQVASINNVLNCKLGTYGDILIRNSVFYNRVKDYSALPCILTSGTGIQFRSLTFENNTLINICGNHGGTSSGLIKYTMTENDKMRNNLYWYDNDVLGQSSTTATDIEKKSHLMSTANYFKTVNFENNLVFHLNETQLSWMYFRTVPKNNVEDGFSNELIFETENPFSSVTPEKGLFIYTNDFKKKGIGASL